MNVKRIDRRNRNDIKYKGKGGLTDAFDDAFKSYWRINDGEYDYLCDIATNDELDYFVSESLTFSEKRKALLILEKMLTDYENTILVTIKNNLNEIDSHGDKFSDDLWIKYKESLQDSQYMARLIHKQREEDFKAGVSAVIKKFKDE